MLRELIALMRPSHYLKNALIFVPIVFSGKLFEGNNLRDAIVATILFCLVASIVYIINDIRDAEKDRQHPKKKFRPNASGNF